ncbi:MAG: hypothetical protein VX463_15200, partial [Pseudomonadota bacterium]|nr:hypothetical protein [Pseudomonadota bacterium]
ARHRTAVGQLDIRAMEQGEVFDLQERSGRIFAIGLVECRLEAEAERRGAGAGAADAPDLP